MRNSREFRECGLCRLRAGLRFAGVTGRYRRRDRGGHGITRFRRGHAVAAHVAWQQHLGKAVDVLGPERLWPKNEAARPIRRGKVLSAEKLTELNGKWGRYEDVDGDGIPYRTYPGTHPAKGAFFTRGTSRDPYARALTVRDAQTGSVSPAPGR